jgi:hypothetical protein
MKSGKSIIDLAAEIERVRTQNRDFIAPTRRIKYEEDYQGNTMVSFGDHTFRPNSLFDSQVATFTKIPNTYVDRLREENPHLLQVNFNAWLRQGSGKRMVRVVDQTARAFLSEAYRPLDNAALAEAVFPVLNDSNLRVVSAELTDRRLYIKAVNERIQGEVKVGDVVQAGVVISNSETGCGALSVSPMLFRLICLNGAISQDLAQRQRHLGRRLGEGLEDVQLLSVEAREADDTATWLALRDFTTKAVEEVMFTQQLNKAKEAAGVRIESPADTLEDVVEVLSQKVEIRKAERPSVLRYLIEGGDFTKWGLMNAVTRTATDVDSYDRSTELERAGAEILEMNARTWNTVSKAGI